MPDVFEGGLPIELFATRNEPDGRAQVNRFIGEGGPGYLPKVVPQINSFASAARSIFSSVQKVGALGFCLGGKVGV